MLVEAEDGSETSLPADKVLVTVGRRPVTQGWGLEELVLDMDGPFIRIDERCQTSMRGIYAIGDVTGEPMLAHRAMAQGEMVAEIVAGHKRGWDKRAIPGRLLHRSRNRRRRRYRRMRRRRPAARSGSGIFLSRRTAGR